MRKSRYTKDLTQVENYELALKDNFRGWVLHHRFETHRQNGTKRKFPIPRKVLIQAGLYINRPPDELIFMDWSEHMKLHGSFGSWNKGTKGICKPNSGSWGQKPAWNKGIKLNEKTRNKISKHFKGKHWKLENGKRVWY